LLASGLLAACGKGGAGASAGAGKPSGTHAPKGIRGVLVQGPGLSKPQFTLTDTSGQPFDLPAQTAGYVTLLYFGYTHCPDICPTHMANIATALHQLPASVTSHIKVLFVTTDPTRDTAPVLRNWLNNFDASFVGLTGTATEIHQAEQATGMSLSTMQFLGGGNYAVDHAGQVDAFTTDNVDHVMYPGGIKASDWVNDLPKLVGGWPKG
jgi:protein SCO1/2